MRAVRLFAAAVSNYWQPIVLSVSAFAPGADELGLLGLCQGVKQVLALLIAFDAARQAPRPADGWLWLSIWRQRGVDAGGLVGRRRVLLRCLLSQDVGELPVP